MGAWWGHSVSLARVGVGGGWSGKGIKMGRVGKECIREKEISSHNPPSTSECEKEHREGKWEASIIRSEQGDWSGTGLLGRKALQGTEGGGDFVCFSIWRSHSLAYS